MNFPHVDDELISVEIANDFCLQTLAGRRANRLRKNLCQDLSPDNDSVYTVARCLREPSKLFEFLLLAESGDANVKT
jgi:hypothetical protein